MKKKLFAAILLPVLLATIISFGMLPIVARRQLVWPNFPIGYEHGIALDLGDGLGPAWYFKGPGSIIDGVIDVPGHVWKQVGTYHVFGLHFNVGPGGAPSWWAKGEPDGVLLFVVEGRIEPWSVEIANKMAKEGFVHYHELVRDDGTTENEVFVVWLKHTAVYDFTFDGGPPMLTNYEHDVFKNRVDYLFMPNYFMPYPET